jgi:hypothetical protein
MAILDYGRRLILPLLYRTGSLKRPAFAPGGMRFN